MPLVRVVTACLPDLRLCRDVLPGAVRNSIADELPEIAPGRLDLNSLVHAQRHSDAVQIKAPRFLRFAHFAENGLDLLGTDMQKPRPTRGSPAGVADLRDKSWQIRTHEKLEGRQLAAHRSRHRVRCLDLNQDLLQIV